MIYKNQFNTFITYCVVCNIFVKKPYIEEAIYICKEEALYICEKALYIFPTMSFPKFGLSSQSRKIYLYM
jgi:hypothetical protein